MFSAIILIAHLFGISYDPKESAKLAASLVNRPEIAGDLVKICQRESRCKPISQHAIDSWAAPRVYEKQVARNKLNPLCQFKEQGWSTRGSFGLIAAYHIDYLPDVPCLPPQVFDVPLFSAIVAAKKYTRRCVSNTSDRWCPSARATRES